MNADRVVELAQTAYRAYGEAMNYKSLQGNPMMTWDDLPQKSSASLVSKRSCCSF